MGKIIELWNYRARAGVLVARQFVVLVDNFSFAFFQIRTRLHFQSSSSRLVKLRQSGDNSALVHSCLSLRALLHMVLLHFVEIVFNSFIDTSDCGIQDEEEEEDILSGFVG